MKRIITILLALFCTISFAQNDSSSINKVDKSGKKQGVWKKYENGRLVYEGQFKDDVPYGTFKYYHENGKLKSVTDFIQGVHKVKTTIYYDNGHKASEGSYIDQQKDGVWNYYNQNDILVKVEGYNAGSRHGLWKTYSPEDGVLLEECEFANGLRNGSYKTYYTNGKISLDETYLNGKTNGKSTAYYPNGNISVTGNYLKGWRDGEWHQYDVNGKIRNTTVYKGKQLVNTYVYMYQKGVGQRLNQNLIAYFVKNGPKTNIVLKNGNKISVDEALEEVESWLDLTLFVRVNPRYIVSMDALVGYKNADDSGDAVIVKVTPEPDEEIYSEGVEAKIIKSIFNTEKPIQ